MFTKKSIIRMFSVLLVVLMMSSTAVARPLEAALGTDFTYQGKLTDGGLPASGTYDLELKLFDALNGGAQVGSTVPKDDVTITNGLFTVQLDFGNVFSGTALYLEIGVRPGASVGAYTTLTPRQQLNATPYSVYASKAPWNGLTGMPAGFADGVDDNTTYTAGDGLELVGTQFKGKGTSFQNVVIVAQSGGDYTTITAALNSIMDASMSNRYLIYVAPGVYTERVTMKQFVDIEGAGESTTKITFTGSDYITGTVVGASWTELRFLSVENTGSNPYATAIYNNGVSLRLTHVNAGASGGTASNYGMYNTQSHPTMTNVTAYASGGTSSYGMVNDNSLFLMMNVSVSASGATNNNFGMYNNSSSVTLANVNASAAAGTNSYGVYNYQCGPTINNSVITSGGASNSYGIYNIAASGIYTLRVNNSQISGGTNSIYNYSGFTTRVGASQLSGGAVSVGGGIVTCAGVYDENYVFSASTCP
jgi:Pectinesterase